MRPESLQLFDAFRRDVQISVGEDVWNAMWERTRLGNQVFIASLYLWREGAEWGYLFNSEVTFASVKEMQKRPWHTHPREGSARQLTNMTGELTKKEAIRAALHVLSMSAIEWLAYIED